MRAAAAVCCCFAALSGLRADALAPNILLVMVDDLGNYVGALGDALAATPNLDALAQSSAVFSGHHVQAPVCGPSRTSMLFSLRMPQTRVRNFEPFRQDTTRRLRALPQLLRDHGGYSTHSIGKVMDMAQFTSHKSEFSTAPEPCAPRKAGMQCSWDTVYSFDELRHPVNNCSASREKRGEHFFSRVSGGDPAVIDHCFATNATQLIRSLPADKPWFVAVGFRRPHLPWACTAEDFEHFAGVNFARAQPLVSHGHPSAKQLVYPSLEIRRQYSGFANTAADHAQAVRAYYACVRQTDRMIAKVLSAVNFTTTAVLVWGDNGFSLGDGGMWGKKSLFREMTATPLMVRWPELLPPGERTAPVESLDILPTIAEIAGIHPERSWAGRTLTNMTGRTQALTTSDLWGPNGSAGTGIARNTEDRTTTAVVFVATAGSYQLTSRTLFPAAEIRYSGSQIELLRNVNVSWARNLSREPQWRTELMH
jgi:iduronate 2-sulfatase